MQEDLLPATQAAVEALGHNPKTPFDCIFGDGPAVTILEMNRGCVTMPNQLQTLCPQHTISANPLDECIYVVDLSWDAQWTLHHWVTSEPLFVLDRERGLTPWEEWEHKPTK